MSRLLSIISVLLIVVCITSVAACGSDDDGSETTADVNQVLNDAAAQWEATDTVHFELEIDGDTFLDDAETINLRGASGDMKRPSSVKAEASIEASLLNADVSLIFIEGDAYMTDLVTGSWTAAPSDFSYDPSILLNNDDGLAQVLRSLEDPTLEGTEEVQDREAYHITATVPGSTVERLTAGAISSERVDVEVWIDTESSNILKLRVAQNGDDRVWTITLSDHGEPVEINRPDI